jgi:hypothetical protein
MGSTTASRPHIGRRACGGVCPKADVDQARFLRHQKTAAGIYATAPELEFTCQGTRIIVPHAFWTDDIASATSVAAYKGDCRLFIIPVLGAIADTPARHFCERHALPGAGDHHPSHSIQRSRHRLRFVDYICSCFARSAQLRESSLRTPLAA